MDTNKPSVEPIKKACATDRIMSANTSVRVTVKHTKTISEGETESFFSTKAVDSVTSSTPTRSGNLMACDIFKRFAQEKTNHPFVSGADVFSFQTSV